MLYFQKLKTLSLGTRVVHANVLEDFCSTMKQITQLDLGGVMVCYDPCYDGVLKAIGNNMHHLTSLDISFSRVTSNAINYLLPTEENSYTGCSKLVFLNLIGVQSLNVCTLKNIILSLPKLRCLKHEMLISALVGLTEEEMDKDTGRCLQHLRGLSSWELTRSLIRYDLLPYTPVYQRLDNITVVDIDVAPQFQHFLIDLLLPLNKLKSLSLCGMSNSHQYLLPVLEVNGAQLEFLNLIYLSGNLNVYDIIRTCPFLMELTMLIDNYSENHKHPEQLANDIPVLPFLRKASLVNMDAQLCSKDMLTALLRSPDVQDITLNQIEVMSDDVLFNVMLPTLSGRAPLLKMKNFNVIFCEAITATPFVEWLQMTNILLEELKLSDCCNVDFEVLKAAAMKYSRNLMLI